MKYLKTYESYKSILQRSLELEQEIADLAEEFSKKKSNNKYEREILENSIEDEILEWMKSHNMNFLDIIYSKNDSNNYYTNDIEVPETKSIWYYDEHDDEVELFKLGTDSYQVLNIIDERFGPIPFKEFLNFNFKLRTLKYIENLTPEMIEQQKIRHESEKFNF